MLRSLGRRAFTLLETVVAIAIVLILASVIAPSLIAYADEQRAEDTAALLTKVSTGLVGANGFRSKIGSNAGRVSQLTNRPTANNAAIDDDSCGGAITGAEQGTWDSNSPFVGFMIPRSGLVTPMGVAEDTMSRNPNTNAVGVNQIVFKNVDLRDVLLLDVFVDGNDGAGSGFIRWNTPPLVMFYRVTLDNRC